MRKKVFLSFLVALSLFIITGCGNNQSNSGGNKNGNGNSNGNQKTTNDKKLDHKVYKYMKISSSNASGLLHVAYLFDDPSVVGSGDNEYNPCFIAEFDTNTGKAKSVKFYSFFLDYEGSTEWVDKAIEKFDSSTGEYKKSFSNVTKGRVNENVTYLVADADPTSYMYNQYIESLFYEQDIEKYKDDVFYSRLYNYDPKPEAKTGNNFFEEPLESIRIEWSDSEIKAY